MSVENEFVIARCKVLDCPAAVIVKFHFLTSIFAAMKNDRPHAFLSRLRYRF